MGEGAIGYIQLHRTERESSGEGGGAKGAGKGTARKRGSRRGARKRSGADGRAQSVHACRMATETKRNPENDNISIFIGGKIYTMKVILNKNEIFLRFHLFFTTN